MQVLDFILELVNSTLDIMAFLYLLKFLFCHEINLSKKLWICCASSQILTNIIETSISKDDKTLISLVMFSTIIIFLSYGIEGLKKMLYIIPTTLIILLPELIISLLLWIFIGTSVMNIMDNYSKYWGPFIDIIFILLTNYKIDKKCYFILNNWDLSAILSANILSLIISEVIDKLQNIIMLNGLIDKLIFISISLTAIAMDISIVVSIIKSKSAMHYKSVSEVNEYYMEMQLQHFESYKNSQKQTRSLKHDMKNHMICIRDLCANGKYNELMDYVQTLQENITTLDSTFNTGNSIADSIINEKYLVMEKNHIVFELKGKFQEKCLISPVHLCTIFANAIDNAIEACIKIEKNSLRKINIEIKNSRNFLVLNFKNSIEDQVKIEKNKIKTSKWDKKNHGFGLENIKAVAEKYNGNCDIQVTKDTFELEIVLPN